MMTGCFAVHAVRSAYVYIERMLQPQNNMLEVASARNRCLYKHVSLLLRLVVTLAESLTDILSAYNSVTRHGHNFPH
jgi:hypothetical protein